MKEEGIPTDSQSAPQTALTTQALSPRAAGEALGVSESSIKRWVDQGKLQSSKSAGGHRKIAVTALIAFAREHGYAFAHPERIGLPATNLSERSLAQSLTPFTKALMCGDRQSARAIFLSLHLRQIESHLLIDELIQPAFKAIGDQWQHGDIYVYEERRATEIAAGLLFELVQLLPHPNPDGPSAIGGALEWDRYQLPGRAVEIVLKEQGWTAQFLGAGLPTQSLAQAIVDQKPDLIWLSVSVEDHRLLQSVQHLCDIAESQGTVVLLGGRVLSAELRNRLRYAMYCENMSDLSKTASFLFKQLSASSS